MEQRQAFAFLRGGFTIHTEFHGLNTSPRWTHRENVGFRAVGLADSIVIARAKAGAEYAEAVMAYANAVLCSNREFRSGRTGQSMENFLIAVDRAHERCMELVAKLKMSEQ